ncbi:Histidine triad (HIT) protein [Corchorus capsularis]|uniref:Histidine triad (HIT) protein n=1 Tax=Corchorus capsularis TaxID=210143 RepID=A0A1R3HI98_COCAP|nr:Histidine triad (HIT) protein [Corchorus capsularis]
MEARRRLAILSSHLCSSPSPSPSPSPSLSASPCAASDTQSQSQSQPPSEDTTLRNDCLYEDDTCLCILDTSPLSRGHSLIIPKSHFSSLDRTPPSVVAAMCSKVPIIGNAIMKATGSDSFNLLVNNGAAAGQVIFHTHIHIIPRKARDCLWTSESLHRRPLKLDQEASGRDGFGMHDRKGIEGAWDMEMSVANILVLVIPSLFGLFKE